MNSTAIHVLHSKHMLNSVQQFLLSRRLVDLLIKINFLIYKNALCKFIHLGRFHMKMATKIFSSFVFSSVQFSCSVVSDSLRPHESQYTRPPCPSPSPRVHPNSCPSSQRCHPAISSSVIPFSSYPQSLPASESFPMS